MADKLVELGRENAELRAEVRQLREDARDAKSAREDAERRARTLAERSRELEGRAEMAEANLRALLASARTGAKQDTPVGDAEMAAILGVLRGAEAGAAGMSEADGADGPAEEPTAAG